MHLLRLLPLLLTLLLVWLLDTGHGTIPPLGRFLDPVNGAMQAAEPTAKNFNQQLKIKGLQQAVEIDLEDRLVPHIEAQNDHDLYLAQGYIHAYFRLWQMDLQTRAAGGRISEIVGKKAFKFDQGQRRKGMVYAAERSLQTMEAEPHTKAMLDAYTEGINYFINTLKYRDLPLEYKLMDFKPETWTNLRSALLLKYMADDLTGASDDISYTMLRDQLGQEQFDFLFPEKIKGSKPVIPEGTKFDAPSLSKPAYPGDSVWVRFDQKGQGRIQNPKSKIQNGQQEEPERGIGSNNWVISGKHTSSGAPVLCNDPHLSLSLPSLWFEIQLTAPGINTYGVSLPGAPGVVIGFNENISWGFTNNYRDVKDYYRITADDRETYLFNGRQTPFQKRAEQIVIKDSVEVVDTVLYTVHGPVQYEPRFPDPAKTGQMLAMCWMAHRGTNELLALYLVNRAKDYESFTSAIQYFQCPAQNFAYADKAGNIAMWGQGQFINKWKGQGKFVMEGKDSLTLWGQDIPMRENPHAFNPEQGYLASANQNVTDTTYPYWYNGSFSEFRSWEINQALTPPLIARGLFYYDAITCHFCNNPLMQELQNSVYSILAEKTIPLFERYTSYHFVADSMQNDSYVYPPSYIVAGSAQSTLFQILWSSLYKNIWQDDFPNSNTYPSAERTMQLVLGDSTSEYYDDKRTPQREDLKLIVQRAYKETTDSLQKLKATGTDWYKVKNTSLMHLTKQPAFSYTQLKTGGWGNTINAMKGNHGPSWRMIVCMAETPEAYGIYPGGQSGNPGSIHYGDNVDQWVTGKYNKLKFVTAAQSKEQFRYRITLTPA